MSDRRAKTVVVTGPRRVEVQDRPVRSAGPGDVVVENVFSGISAGTEMNVYRGVAPQWRARRDPVTGLFEASSEPQWTYPLVYGYAAVGRVCEVGRDVGAEGPKVGDLVFSWTAHAGTAVVPWGEVVVLPPLRDEQMGVLLANTNTAVTGVLDVRPTVGDVGVVSGLGVIGLLALQILRRAGVGLLVGVDRIERRRELARVFGADVVLSPSDSVAEEVRRISDNRGADWVVEVSGASAALNEAIRTVGYNGRVIAMSWYGGSFESLSLAGEFHHNRPRLISSQAGGINPDLGPLWTVQRRMQLAVRLLAELDLAPLLTHTFPVADAASAYALIDGGDEKVVQCVLSYR